MVLPACRVADEHSLPGGRLPGAACMIRTADRDAIDRGVPVVELVGGPVEAGLRGLQHTFGFRGCIDERDTYQMHACGCREADFHPGVSLVHASPRCGI